MTPEEKRDRLIDAAVVFAARGDDLGFRHADDLLCRASLLDDEIDLPRQLAMPMRDRALAARTTAAAQRPSPLALPLRDRVIAALLDAAAHRFG